MRLRRLALLSVFALAACGDSAPTTDKGSGGTFTPQEPKFGPSNNQPGNNNMNNMTGGSNNGTNNGTTGTNNGTTGGMAGGRFCAFQGTLSGGLDFTYAYNAPEISCASNTNNDVFNSIGMLDTLFNDLRVTVDPSTPIAAGETPADLNATVTVIDTSVDPEERWSSATCAMTVTTNEPGMNEAGVATTRIEFGVVCSTALEPEAPNTRPAVGVAGVQMRTEATFQ